MKQKTYLSNALSIADTKAKYDAEVKKILSAKVILAWIMKFSVEEFKDYTIEEIMSSIEGEPEIATIPVYPGKVKQQAITGLQTEDKVPNEGEVTYDIRFYAITPTKQRVKLIINVEAQKEFKPGYSLVTRGVFYCARMLSAQLGTEFTADNYDNIKKVYSIWICMDTPSYAKNTITEYSMKQNKLYGDFNGEERFDLLSVVMICLGENADLEQGTELHGLLSTILSDELTVPRKEEILQKNFGIEPYNVKEVVTSMCNLSDLIEEKGIKKGIEQGKFIFVRNMLRRGMSDEDIMDLAECSQEFVDEVRKMDA